MTAEERIRVALQASAAGVEPPADMWERIRRRSTRPGRWQRVTRLHSPGLVLLALGLAVVLTFTRGSDPTTDVTTTKHVPLEAAAHTDDGPAEGLAQAPARPEPVPLPSPVETPVEDSSDPAPPVAAMDQQLPQPVDSPECTIDQGFLWPVEGACSKYPVTQVQRSDAVQSVTILVPPGTPVRAGAGARVKRAEREGAYGIEVVLVTDDGFELWYGHLSGLAVTESAMVKKGQVLGYAGNTGWATGPSVRFEVHKPGTEANPTPSVAEKGQGEPEPVETQECLTDQGHLWPVEGACDQYPVTHQSAVNTVASMSIFVPSGTPIRAGADAIVKQVGWQGLSGIVVVLVTSDGYELRYGHLSGLLVSEGNLVKKGQTVGYAGVSGWTTSPSVRLEVRQLKAVQN